MKTKRIAYVDKTYCVACGNCVEMCPVHVITIGKEMYAKVNEDKCVGCGRCEKVCPASTIYLKEKNI